MPAEMGSTGSMEVCALYVCIQANSRPKVFKASSQANSSFKRELHLEKGNNSEKMHGEAVCGLPHFQALNEPGSRDLLKPAWCSKGRVSQPRKQGIHIQQRPSGFAPSFIMSSALLYDSVSEASVSFTHTPASGQYTLTERTNSTEQAAAVS